MTKPEDPYEYEGVEWLAEYADTRYGVAVSYVQDAQAIFERLLKDPVIEPWKEQIEEFLKDSRKHY